MLSGWTRHLDSDTDHQLCRFIFNSLFFLKDAYIS
jgi:hypothetical protein